MSDLFALLRLSLCSFLRHGGCDGSFLLRFCFRCLLLLFLGQDVLLCDAVLLITRRLIPRVDMQTLLRAALGAVATLDTVEAVDGPGVLRLIDLDGTCRTGHHAESTADTVLDVDINMTSGAFREPSYHPTERLP